MLGNKKSVDITVVRSPTDVATVDVKAVVGKMDRPVGSLDVEHPEPHFLVLLCYNHAFVVPVGAPPPNPDLWVVPFAEAPQFVKPYKRGMNVVSKGFVAAGDRYRHAWDLLGLRGTGAPPATVSI
jgi:hypothetical protein